MPDEVADVAEVPDRFWAEGTAQWAAKRLDSSLTDLERFLPAFFAAGGRSLDAPANGVASAFLYGAAIWPTYLQQRLGADLVRQILEQEGQAGDDALAAAEVVLQRQGTSLAAEYPRFATWNLATGTRAGSGGYADAAAYPMAPVTELDQAASGISSSLASFAFHVHSAGAAALTLTTDATRNVGTLVPLVGGVARLDAAAPLPAMLDGDGLVRASVAVSAQDFLRTFVLDRLPQHARLIAPEHGRCRRLLDGESVAPR